MTVIELLLNDKTDSELLLILVKALTFDGRAILNKMPDDGYGSDYDAHVFIIEEICNHVTPKTKEKVDN